MQHPELPLFAFLSAILVLIPVIWHWKSRNTAVIAMALWLAMADVINGVNAIVWAGNVQNPIPVWCDITTKLLVGASYALPLATLCICKHLEMVSSSRKVSYDARDRKRRMLFEAFMCYGLPVIFMALHYIVQGHRYDIIENTGCQAAVYISVQAILIIWFPQLLFSVIALIYASLALHHFVRRRLTFATHLQNSNSSLTPNRYLRLIAMAATEIVWATTLTSYNLWSNVSGGIRPWTNWADVHSNFSRVAVFLTIELPPQLVSTLMLFWWTLPASSLIFFVFLGFGEEAVKQYKAIWNWFRITILHRTPPEKELQAGSFPSKRGMKPLHLVNLNLKTTSSYGSSSIESPSPDYQVKLTQTFNSHLSSSTLDASKLVYYEPKKTRALEQDSKSSYNGDSAPSYYSSTTAYEQEIALPIDTTRVSHSSPAVHEIPSSPASPELDGCDTFTISTFSYYGGPPHMDSQNLLTSPAISMFPPETPTTIAPQSLPPPPRRGPRRVESHGSVNTVLPNVPEDVGSASYERRRVLGISGGGIFVTVQQEALTDSRV